MATTYEKIATTTLGSSSATTTFSSISGAYTDLVIVVNETCGAGSGLNVRFNSDTGSNYSSTFIYGDGSTATSGRQTSQTFGTFGNTGGSTRGTTIVNLQNYSNTTTYKTYISRTSTTGSVVGSYVSLWRNTAAITSVELYPNSTTWSSGSTFTIYGIKAA
jgi:hypothetical protein